MGPTQSTRLESVATLSASRRIRGGGSMGRGAAGQRTAAFGESCGVRLGSGLVSQQELCRGLGPGAEVVARCVRLAQLGFGATATPRAETGPTAAPPQTRPARARSDPAQRRGLRAGPPQNAGVLLGRRAADSDAGFPGRPWPTGAVETISSAGARWHHHRAAALATVGSILRHGQERPRSPYPSPHGDAAVSVGARAVPLRTDALHRRRTPRGPAAAAGVGNQRFGPAGSRLLELRFVLADATPAGVFRHAAESGRALAHAAPAGTRRPHRAAFAQGLSQAMEAAGLARVERLARDRLSNSRVPQNRSRNQRARSA